MEFEDIEVNNLVLRTPFDLCHLIIKFLCDENYSEKLWKKDEKLLTVLMGNVKSGGLNYRQLNELLLNQDKLGSAFFDFFFEKDKITLDELKKGIAKFRGFALLCYGNYRFAYKELIRQSHEYLVAKLTPFCLKTPELVRTFEKRPQKMLAIEDVPRERTWCLGYISGKTVNKEAAELEKEKLRAKKGKSRFKENELFKLGVKLGQMATKIQEAQELAFRNTAIYLTWDYMDVYVATSMRNKWEFEETFDFVRAVFSDAKLRNLNLRYFDPTQSMCGNSREKGLIEGLMLKRAFCTIYLAQESDTMGKDSELAATLAQSKPVIAYVPRYDSNEYSKRIKRYPLSYFKKRLLILDAEEVFEDQNCIRRIEKINANFGKAIDDFLVRFNEYRSEQPFTLWTEKEEKFKKDCDVFPQICKILAVGECYNFDRRADLLKGIHPLSMQVDLQSGVANGVLVVRSPEECVDLLHRILTNQMEFKIRHKKEGYTILEEMITQSPFRVVVDNQRLTNSFWNLFNTS